MKKLVLSLGLGLSLITGAYATGNTLDQLNAQVEKTLAPFQDQNTVAKLVFDAVETSTERAEKVALHSFYKKIGSQNIFSVKIDNLSYNYGDGTTPMTTLRGSVGVDFTKLLPQQEINQIFSQASEYIEQFANSNMPEIYGDAVSVRGVVTSTSHDSRNNYTALTALLSLRIDLSKLPEDVPHEDIIATDAVLSISLDVKTGIIVDAYLVSNPEYRGFQEGQEGLKELLDQLLNNDEDALAQILGYIQTLDDIASYVVESDNSLIYQGGKFLLSKLFK